jgi:type III pantothenate kinase
MLLAIDIGNTNITIGMFKDEELKATWRIATGIHRMPDEYGMLLISLLRQQGLDTPDVTKISMCCVVPPLNAVFEEMFGKYFHVEPLIVRAGVKTGVRIRMDNPSEVGADRIADAAAAHHLYGGPVIVVDLGTSINFDTVSKEGDYLGGAVAPGLSMAAESLFQRTALLPRVGLTSPERAIGTSTIAAMQSGLVFGFVGLIEGIIGRIEKELGDKARVVATGGYAQLIAKETPIIDDINPDLTLIGLRLIYMMNRT